MTDVEVWPFENPSLQLQRGGVAMRELSQLGNIEGLYGRMPSDLQRIVRKIADASNYDFAAMEFLDYLNVEWRLEE